MSKRKTQAEYKKQFLELSKAMIHVLTISDRKEEYLSKDLKASRVNINVLEEKITFIPSREDSLERLWEEGQQFEDSSETPEDAVVNALMRSQLRQCLRQLPEQEYALIQALFYEQKSEHEWSRETGTPRMTIHNRKQKILLKIRKLLEK